MIVIDTSALVAILNKKPERDRFLAIISEDDRPMISAVAFYETMLVIGARSGPEKLTDLEDLIATAQAQIVPFDAEQALAAQRAYMRYGKGIDPNARLNLCDCASYALAKTLDAPLLYKGDDFAATDVVRAA